MERETYRTY